MSELFLERLDGRLTGEVDVAVASTAETDFLAVARCVAGSTFVVECAGLTFIDSAGVRMLERVAQRSGKRLQLANVPHSCRRVFELLDVCELFGIERLSPRVPVGGVAVDGRAPAVTVSNPG